MDKDDINIWRFNLHTHEGAEKQKETFEYCEQNSIIGTGWRTDIRLMSSKDEYIPDKEFYHRLDTFSFSNQKGFKKAMKSLREMKKDDLIWTRKNNCYYICRVTENARDFMPGEREKTIEDRCYDIWHYVPCEYVKIGTEDNVIGKIVRSFNMGVVCHIRGRGKENIVKEFSKKTYNQYTGKEYYKIEKPKNKWDYLWESIGALEIEELVGLYMQIELGYGIYTSTNKKDTKEYEYILFKRQNPKERAKLQVKTSGINLNEYNVGDIPFYFFTLGNYYKDGKVLKEDEKEKYQKLNKVKFLTKEELLEFSKRNEKVLPYKINWF